MKRFSTAFCTLGLAAAVVATPAAATGVRPGGAGAPETLRFVPRGERWSGCPGERCLLRGGIEPLTASTLIRENVWCSWGGIPLWGRAAVEVVYRG